jgi:magnesium-transporting ATPase (P-type)
VADATTTHADDPRGTGLATTDDVWHALPVAEVTERLGTDARRGLSEDEAAERLRRDGPNELERDEPRGDLEIVLDQFKSPLIYILLVAAAVTVAIDEYADAAVIATVLVINAVIGFIQERRADRAVHALMELAAPHSVVVRDGTERKIDSTELVRGDLVVLTSGSRVPADLRLVAATALEIDESLLTGESSPARKAVTPVAEHLLVADRASMAFMGSIVASGRARGTVTATGLRTELGAIAESIRGEPEPETPLQQRMRRFADVIGLAVLASTVVAFALGVGLGEPVGAMFRTAVALAVAVVPEGLPVAFTVAMALGVRRMARRNALIRSLPAVETLGSTTVIGSDKTGTLTANRMTVLRGWTADGWVAFHRDGDDPLGDGFPDAAEHLAIHPDGALLSTLRTGVLDNEADLVVDGDEVLEHRGDPTETALLEAGHRVGHGPHRLRPATEILVAVPFEPDQRYSYAVVDEDGPVMRCKGAPERVLDACVDVRVRDGTAALDTTAVLAAAAEMAHRGLRVLAMAERRLAAMPASAEGGTLPAPTGLTFTGLLGMEDPPRSGVRDAIDRCRQAGIRVVMITGDHAITARAIAHRLGIGDDTTDTATADTATAAATVLTGVDLETMHDDALEQAVTEVDVFARVAPEHKLRVVRALRTHGEVVAVTGDGVNDGPALKAADIGIAMGQSGTDVAREASDMVLTDDDFVSIAAAVEEGRVVFDNVRKVTYFLLSTGAAAIVAILASLAMGLPLPYVPAALLWLNVVTNGLQDVALAFERGEPDVLDHPPRGRGEDIVGRVLWERTLLTGVTMAAGSLWLYTWAIGQGVSQGQQRGAALTTLVLAMAAHVYNARSERRSIVRTHVAGNRFLLGSTIVALTVHVLATYWGPTQTLLGIEAVDGSAWWRMLLVALAVIVVSEIHKLARGRRRLPGPGGSWRPR